MELHQHRKASSGYEEDEEYVADHDSIMAREKSLVSIVFSGETMFSMPAFGTCEDNHCRTALHPTEDPWDLIGVDMIGPFTNTDSGNVYIGTCKYDYCRTALNHGRKTLGSDWCRYGWPFHKD